MSDSTHPGVSTLLILQLRDRPDDAKTWEQFVERHSGVIYGWCRQWHLQDADAQDVTQNVFAGLLAGLRTFDRSKGRFRTWLYRVVRSRVSDWCGDHHRHMERGTEAVRERLASEEARLDLEKRLNDQFDLELVEIAEARVRLRVSAPTWTCFQLFKKEGLSLHEAAKQTGLPVGHVSKYAMRVVAMLTKEVQGLQEQMDGSDFGPAEGA
jgi:RNA polymerase sigma-70 factor (ECF subfamily)